MKDGCLSKLTITESSNRAIQFKKIVNALPVYCADKGYRYIDNVICKNTELLEAAFLPPYLDASRWSITFHIEIETVDPASAPGTNSSRTPTKEMVEKTQFFNANLQKKLLAEYEQKSDIKSKEQSKLIANKQSLITILFGQCNDATRTKMDIGTTYKADCGAGNLINFLTRLQTISYKRNGGVLS